MLIYLKEHAFISKKEMKSQPKYPNIVAPGVIIIKINIFNVISSIPAQALTVHF